MDVPTRVGVDNWDGWDDPIVTPSSVPSTYRASTAAVSPADELREWLADMATQSLSPMDQDVVSPHVDDASQLQYTPPVTHREQALVPPTEMPKRAKEDKPEKKNPLEEAESYVQETHSMPGGGEITIFKGLKKGIEKKANEPDGGWDAWGGEPDWEYAERCPYCGSPNTGSRTARSGPDEWLQGECRDCLSSWTISQDQPRGSGEADPAWNEFWRGASHDPQIRTADAPINSGDATVDALGKPPSIEPSPKVDMDYLEAALCPICYQTHRPDEPCPDNHVEQYHQQERHWYNRDPNTVHAPEAHPSTALVTGAARAGAYDWSGDDPTVGSGRGMDRYIGWVPTEHLTPEFDRSQTAPPEKLEALKQSLLTHGFHEPVWVDYHPDTNMAHVSEGNHRLTVAQQAGIPAIPVAVMRSMRTPRNPSVLRGPYQYIGDEGDPFTGDPPQYMHPRDIGLPEAQPWTPPIASDTNDLAVSADHRPSQAEAAVASPIVDVVAETRHTASVVAPSADILAMGETIAKLAAAVENMQKPGPPPEAKKPRKLIIQRDEQGRMASIEEA